jgi:hypothetical protein
MLESDAHREKQFPQSWLTEEGMQMDERDEHPKKAELPMQQRSEPDSNVTVERDSHPEKQWPRSSWIVGGMDIDTIDTQSENNQRSIRESREPASNVRHQTVRRPEKQPGSRRSIVLGIIMRPSFPRHLLIAVHSKFIRKFPLTLKWQFPSSTEISSIFVVYRAKQLSSRRPDGRQIDESDEHPVNAEASIRESLEPDSNVMVEREPHPAKQ